jgi:hypothetical protein
LVKSLTSVVVSCRDEEASVSVLELPHLRLAELGFQLVWENAADITAPRPL